MTMAGSNAKPTPAPWKAETDEKAAAVFIMGPISNKQRCRMSDGLGLVVKVDCAENPDAHSFSPMNAERVANARLIAAAPELLAALTKARDWLDYENSPMGPAEAAQYARLMKQIEAAIAKAEGVQ